MGSLPFSQAFFYFILFIFCSWHRGGKCGELLRSPKKSPECGFVTLRQVFFFSPYMGSRVISLPRLVNLHQLEVIKKKLTAYFEHLTSNQDTETDSLIPEDFTLEVIC